MEKQIIDQTVLTQAVEVSETYKLPITQPRQSQHLLNHIYRSEVMTPSNFGPNVIEGNESDVSEDGKGGKRNIAHKRVLMGMISEQHARNAAAALIGSTKVNSSDEIFGSDYEDDDIQLIQPEHNHNEIEPNQEGSDCEEHYSDCDNENYGHSEVHCDRTGQTMEINAQSETFETTNQIEDNKVSEMNPEELHSNSGVHVSITTGAPAVTSSHLVTGAINENTRVTNSCGLKMSISANDTEHLESISTSQNVAGHLGDASKGSLLEANVSGHPQSQNVLLNGVGEIHTGSANLATSDTLLSGHLQTLNSPLVTMCGNPAANETATTDVNPSQIHNGNPVLGSGSSSTPCLIPITAPMGYGFAPGPVISGLQLQTNNDTASFMSAQNPSMFPVDGNSATTQLLNVAKHSGAFQLSGFVPTLSSNVESGVTILTPVNPISNIPGLLSPLSSNLFERQLTISPGQQPPVSVSSLTLQTHGIPNIPSQGTNEHLPNDANKTNHFAMTTASITSAGASAQNCENVNKNACQNLTIQNDEKIPDTVLVPMSSNEPTHVPALAVLPEVSSVVMTSGATSVVLTTSPVSSTTPTNTSVTSALSSSVSVSTYEQSPVCPSSTSQMDHSTSDSITNTWPVPFGWKRQIEDSGIVYYSASKVRLPTMEHIQTYLQMDGTCKCGLECPVLTKDIFNFNSQVPTKEPSVEDILKNKDFKHNLCNHKRKIVAMAAFHHSATLQKAAASSVKHVQSKEKQRKVVDIVPKKGPKSPRRVKPKHKYDGVLVSQLLAERDKLNQEKQQQQTAQEQFAWPSADSIIQSLSASGMTSTTQTITGQTVSDTAQSDSNRTFQWPSAESIVKSLQAAKNDPIIGQGEDENSSVQTDNQSAVNIKNILARLNSPPAVDIKAKESATKVADVSGKVAAGGGQLHPMAPNMPSSMIELQQRSMMGMQQGMMGMQQGMMGNYPQAHPSVVGMPQFHQQQVQMGFPPERFPTVMNFPVRPAQPNQGFNFPVQTQNYRPMNFPNGPAPPGNMHPMPDMMMSPTGPMMRPNMGPNMMNFNPMFPGPGMDTAFAEPPKKKKKSKPKKKKINSLLLEASPPCPNVNVLQMNEKQISPPKPTSPRVAPDGPSKTVSEKEDKDLESRVHAILGQARLEQERSMKKVDTQIPVTSSEASSTSSSAVASPAIENSKSVPSTMESSIYGSSTPVTTTLENPVVKCISSESLSATLPVKSEVSASESHTISSSTELSPTASHFGMSNASATSLSTVQEQNTPIYKQGQNSQSLNKQSTPENQLSHPPSQSVIPTSSNSALPSSLSKVPVNNPPTAAGQPHMEDVIHHHGNTSPAVMLPSNLPLPTRQRNHSSSSLPLMSPGRGSASTPASQRSPSRTLTPGSLPSPGPLSPMGMNFPHGHMPMGMMPPYIHHQQPNVPHGYPGMPHYQPGMMQNPGMVPGNGIMPMHGQPGMMPNQHGMPQNQHPMMPNQHAMMPSPHAMMPNQPVMLPHQHGMPYPYQGYSTQVSTHKSNKGKNRSKQASSPRAYPPAHFPQPGNFHPFPGQRPEIRFHTNMPLNDIQRSSNPNFPASHMLSVAARAQGHQGHPNQGQGQTRVYHQMQQHQLPMDPFSAQGIRAAMQQGQGHIGPLPHVPLVHGQHGPMMLPQVGPEQGKEPPKLLEQPSKNHNTPPQLKSPGNECPKIDSTSTSTSGLNQTPCQMQVSVANDSDAMTTIDTTVTNTNSSHPSPIQLVQNMISGLEATQHALAAAAAARNDNTRPKSRRSNSTSSTGSSSSLGRNGVERAGSVDLGYGSKSPGGSASSGSEIGKPSPDHNGSLSVNIGTSLNVTVTSGNTCTSRVSELEDPVLSPSDLSSSIFNTVVSASQHVKNVITQSAQITSEQITGPHLLKIAPAAEGSGSATSAANTLISVQSAISVGMKSSGQISPRSKTESKPKYRKRGTGTRRSNTPTIASMLQAAAAAQASQMLMLPQGAVVPVVPPNHSAPERKQNSQPPLMYFPAPHMKSPMGAPNVTTTMHSHVTVSQPMGVNPAVLQHLQQIQLQQEAANAAKGKEGHGYDESEKNISNSGNTDSPTNCTPVNSEGNCIVNMTTENANQELSDSVGFQVSKTSQFDTYSQAEVTATDGQSETSNSHISSTNIASVLQTQGMHEQGIDDINPNDPDQRTSCATLNIDSSASSNHHNPVGNDYQAISEFDKGDRTDAKQFTVPSRDQEPEHYLAVDPVPGFNREDGDLAYNSIDPPLSLSSPCLDDDQECVTNATEHLAQSEPEFSEELHDNHSSFHVDQSELFENTRLDTYDERGAELNSIEEMPEDGADSEEQELYQNSVPEEQTATSLENNNHLDHAKTGFEQSKNDAEVMGSEGAHGMKRDYPDEDDDEAGLEQDDDCTDSSIENSLFPRTFNIGDLVWGQIRGYPSWPGKLVHEAEVKGHANTNLEFGKMWVKWFGDHSFTQVEPDKLKTLSEGLEAHHRQRKNFRKGRKMNSNLESAIQEAMDDLERQSMEGAESGKQKGGKVSKKRKVK